MDYFITYIIYTTVDGQTSSTQGRCAITRQRPITCIADVHEIETQVLSPRYTSAMHIAMLGWQRFEEFDEDI